MTVFTCTREVKENFIRVILGGLCPRSFFKYALKNERFLFIFRQIKEHEGIGKWDITFIKLFNVFVR